MGEVSHYTTATGMVAAMDRGAVTPLELAEMLIARIEQVNPALNAIVVPTFERAREAARHTGALRAGGQRGPMLGLPITLKESTHVVGTPATAGIPAMKDYQPSHDSRVAASLFAEGAALLGKTNIPLALGDWQSDSPVYGRTNNPWDRGRSPGGSTGGGGAALAAGLTPFEIGSDIGGSIRVPAAYCGVYGHRPSETAVPRSGAFPHQEMPNPGRLMGVQGPLARSVDDLELGMDIIAGPDLGEETGWTLQLPPTRRRELSDFRVAVLPPLSFVSPSSEMAARVDELASFLSARGAHVEQAFPDVEPETYFYDYVRLLNVQVTRGWSRDEREKRAALLRASGDPVEDAQADGYVIDATDYLALLDRRERARHTWKRFFEDWDVLIAPMALDAAFPHDDSAFHTRRLTIDGQSTWYYLNIVYPMWAIYTGLPSTAFPGGLNSSGLPLGLQAIGPYLEDRTTLHFARLLEQKWRAFEPPPGY